ncbi:MAG TPA: hypothetical protein VH593_26595 [Ktedonobacteraceae bacterium]|jgi:hypothetical protein
MRLRYFYTDHGGWNPAPEPHRFPITWFIFRMTMLTLKIIGILGICIFIYAVVAGTGNK